MKKSLATREITRIGIFTALTAILAQVTIPLPFTPVMIAFGQLAVYIAAILLRPKLAVLTQVCYLLIGAVGMPVFSGFRGGLPALFGPTGGYLLVYPVMAWIVSFALNSQAALVAETKRGRQWLFVKAAASIVLAHLVLYAGGSLWMFATSVNTSFAGVLAGTVYPFIPLDIVKIVFCVAAIIPLRTRLLRMNLLGLENN